MEEQKLSNDPREFSPESFKQCERDKRRRIKKTKDFYKSFGKKVIINTYLTIAILSVIALALACWYLWCYSWYPQYAMAEVNYNSPRATTTASPEENIKEWVKAQTLAAGLKWEDVECLIRNESGWRPMAYHINAGGSSLDRGLFMWNDRWNTHISNECAFDWKCSTIEALKKIKADGGYRAWYGTKNCR